MNFILFALIILTGLSLTQSNSHNSVYKSLFAESGYPMLGDIPLLTVRSSSKAIALMAPRGALVGRAFVTGWGRCDFTGQDLCLPRSSIYFPDELMDPMLRSISFVMDSPNNACDVYRQHENDIHRGMLCVGDSRYVKPVAPCLGVPGAALILRGKLVGLLSWGLGCGYAHDLPLIYTNIQHYFLWLVNNVNILKNITRQDIKELFRVTKSYKLSVWLERTREKLIVKPEARYNLQPLSIDTTLSKLEGRLYDIRDFIYNGTFRKEKKDMYKEMKVQHNMTAIHFLPNIPLNTKPFLSNQSIYDEIEYDYDSDVED